MIAIWAWARVSLLFISKNRNWFGKWLNTSVNHNLHYHYFKGNYGLYFALWDRMMGTLRTDYDDSFDEVKNRTKMIEN